MHFDASPASTVEVPASDDEKAQRGGGALLGPAPFCGKEVYVAPKDDSEDENSDEDKNLALAKAIAKRQSVQVMES